MRSLDCDHVIPFVESLILELCSHISMGPHAVSFIYSIGLNVSVCLFGCLHFDFCMMFIFINGL